MAVTVESLVRSDSIYIRTFLPFIQQLAANNNLFQINEAAKIIDDYTRAWKGGNPSRQDNYFVRSAQVKNTRQPQLKQAAETALLANFRYRLTSMNMNGVNSWSDFNLFVELFYALLDPVGPFNTLNEGALDLLECPPDPPSCPPGINYYSYRAGMYRRPYVDGEGTGFFIQETVEGDPTTESEFTIGYRAPFPYTDPHALALNNRYFVLNTDGATGADDIIWYNYEGTGVQPTVVGNGGPQTFIQVQLDRTDEWPSIQAKTDAAIIGGGNWVKAATKVTCYNNPPSVPDCVTTNPDSPDPCRKEVPCPFKVGTAFVAAAVGPRIGATDGRNGYQTPDTTMLASDASTVAIGLLSDKDWETAHNTQRVPYEKTLGKDICYIQSVDFECPLCPPDGLEGYFRKTPWLAVPWILPRNAANGGTTGRTVFCIEI